MAVNTEPARRPWTVRAAQGMFVLNAVIWFVLGGASLARVVSSGRAQTITLAVVALLVLANAVAMLVAGLLLAPRRRWAWLFGLALLAANIVLTFTDQFGLFDLLTLLIDVALLGLLIGTHRLYRTSDPHEPPPAATNP